MPNDPSLVLPSWLVLPMEMNSQTNFLKTVNTFVCWAYFCIQMGRAPSCEWGFQVNSYSLSGWRIISSGSRPGSQCYDYPIFRIERFRLGIGSASAKPNSSSTSPLNIWNFHCTNHFYQWNMRLFTIYTVPFWYYISCTYLYAFSVYQ